jgi:hypothetical protein
VYQGGSISSVSITTTFSIYCQLQWTTVFYNSDTNYNSTQADGNGGGNCAGQSHGAYTACEISSSHNFNHSGSWGWSPYTYIYLSGSSAVDACVT